MVIRLHRSLFSLPNLVSMLRLLMAPVLLWLALERHITWYFLTIGFTVFTDLLDGFLARISHQITALGSKLDSWGDFAIYTTMALCAWLLWPDTVWAYRYACLAILLSLLVPIAVGLIKFGGLTSYHTWSVKIAVATTVISYVLLFSGLLTWPFPVAAALCVLAGAEETGITLTLHRWRPDVRTIWHAMRLRQSKSGT